MNTFFRHAVRSGLGAIMFLCVIPAHSATTGESQLDAALPAASQQDNLLMYADISAFTKVVAMVQLFEQGTPEDRVPVHHAKSNLPQADDPPQSERGQIGSEAIPECRMPRATKTIYNFGAATESECTCELYKRSPLVKVKGATGQDFHWVKTCKKSRYKVTLLAD